MTPIFAFIILGLAIVAGSVYGAARYGTVLNPLTVNCVINLGIFSLGSGVCAYIVWTVLPIYPAGAIAETALLTFVCTIGTIAAFTGSCRWATNLYGRLLSLLGLASERSGRQYSLGHMWLLVALGLLSFVLLAVFGHGGLLWLTDPRDAYVHYELGMHPFFIVYEWSVILLLAYYLWACRPVGARLVAPTLLSMLALYFTGSKGEIFMALAVVVSYYHYQVKKIAMRMYAIILFIVIFAVIGLLVMQRTSGSIQATILYYYQYFDTTAQFIARFSEWGLQYGRAALSSFWVFVPRALVPDKPYDWGILIVNDKLFPGQAAQGYTPEALGWTESYLDFGIPGVFAFGYFSALFQRAAYEYYLRNRSAFFPFLLMVQFALLPVLIYAPIPVAIPLCIGMAVFLRMRVIAHRTDGTSIASASG